MKLLKLGVFGLDLWMPPTRGHDLKLPSSTTPLLSLCAPPPGATS